MKVHSDVFLNGFNSLTNTWIPNLGLSLSTSSEPQSEIRNITVQGNFTIKANCTYQEVGGIHQYNCTSVSECREKSQTTASSAVKGQLKGVCDTLNAKLNDSSLFSSYATKTLPLETFKYCCLVICSPCNGRGNVRCYTCSESGTVTETRYEIVGYDEYRDGRGNITSRTPRREHRNYRVTCSSCSGRGRTTCSTCHGDGQNTHIEKVDVLAKAENISWEWSKFTELDWPNDYLNGNQSAFPLQTAGSWNLSKQKVTDQDNGTFVVVLPGQINACDANAQMKSDYASSNGKLKTLAGKVYDCDYIYDEHLHQIAYQAIEEKKYSPEKIKKITSSEIFNTCGEYSNNGVSIPTGVLDKLNILTTRTSGTLFKLLSTLSENFEQARSKISVLSIALKSIFMFLLIAGGLITFTLSTGTEISEPFRLTDIGKNLSDILFKFNLSPKYLTEFTIITLILFIPSLVLMVIFGAKKNWTTKRIIKWYWITAPIIAALILHFGLASKKASNGNIETLINQIPILNISVFAVLAGILLARKGKWGEQEKIASQYESDVLMIKLDYKE